MEAQENRCTGLDCIYCLTLNCPNEVETLKKIIKNLKEEYNALWHNYKACEKEYMILYNKKNNPR